MCIRPLCSCSPTLYPSTGALTGEIFRNIALRFSEFSATATRIRPRSDNGQVMTIRRRTGDIG